MKSVGLVLVVCMVVTQVGAVDAKFVKVRSALGDVQHFLNNAMRVAGSGCQRVTKYVTHKVCSAITVVPNVQALQLCTAFTVGTELCRGVVEGVQTYCSTYGAQLPGGHTADQIICNAIQRRG